MSWSLSKSSGLSNRIQHPKTEMIALVRRCRKENEIAAMIADGFGKFKILGLLDLVAVAINAQ
jgi:hypothetical protein